MNTTSLSLPGAAAPRPSAPVVLGRLHPTARAAALPVLLLALWALASHQEWMAEQILPPPSAIVATFAEMLSSGDLWANVRISLLRVVEGFTIGTLGGAALGVAMGSSRLVDEMVSPIFRAIAQVPSLGWIPLLILFLGLGESLKLVIIAKAVMIPVTITLADAMRDIPAKYLEVARVFHFSRRTRLFRLVLPAVLPPAFTGIRQGAAHAWVSLVAVEMMASAEGVGYLMSWGRMLFQLDIVMVGMVLVGAIGFVLDFGLRRVERRLARWRLAV